jgi:hypothetical protein
VACIGAAVVGQQRKLSAQNLSCKHFLHNAPFLHALRINKHHFCGRSLILGGFPARYGERDAF